MLTRKTLAAAGAAVVLALGVTAVTVKVTAREQRVLAVTGTEAWQQVHDLACQNGAINCGPDVTTTTTGVTTSTTSATTTPTSTTVLPTTTTSTSTSIPPSSSTSSPTSTTTTAPPATTTTVLATTTTTQPPQIGFPDSSNTGWAHLFPSGTVLPTYTGSCNPASGTVIDSKTINCSAMDFRNSSNVTIKRSKVNGNSFSVIQPGPGFIFSDSEINCNGGSTSNPPALGAEGSYAVNGGPGAVLSRLDVHDCENAVEPGSNSTIQDSYIHAFRAAGAPHYDGISIDGGQSNVMVLHNSIILAQNQTATVMVDNYFGAATGITVKGNRLIGGGYTVYADTQFTSAAVQVKFIDNRLDNWQWGPANTSANANTSGSTGNLRDRDGSAIPI